MSCAHCVHLSAARAAPEGIGRRQRLSVLRGIGWMRLSALRSLFDRQERIFACLAVGKARTRLSRERCRLSHCERPGRLARELDCVVVALLAITRKPPGRVKGPERKIDAVPVSGPETRYGKTWAQTRRGNNDGWRAPLLQDNRKNGRPSDRQTNV